MPIYEYESKHPGKGCEKCRTRFEIFQQASEAPLLECPVCGKPVKKVMSWCRAAIVETPEETARVESKIKQYEKEGMWSHAAELADTHAEKTKDKALKTRALEDYKRAGYDARTLDKHARND
ncbi:MAG: zinc ribbon domain-containing protein [Deltaproteobacteria bacterium]|nr:zinc ribbon domain-containing protein [Deltaproteobacteria bacterium]